MQHQSVPLFHAIRLDVEHNLAYKPHLAYSHFTQHVGTRTVVVLIMAFVLPDQCTCLPEALISYLGFVTESNNYLLEKIRAENLETTTTTAIAILILT